MITSSIKAIIFDIGGVYVDYRMPGNYSYAGKQKLNLLQKFYLSIREVDPEIKQLVLALKKKYTVAAFSNTLGYFAELNKKNGLYNIFDKYVLSSDIHYMKPQKRSYEIMLNQLKLKPEECVFIDNYYLFLVPAKKLGMKTIHFKNVKQLKSELSKLNIKI